MKKLLLAALLAQDDVQSAYAWCVNRYHDRSKGLKWQPGADWLPGFEACGKIVEAVEAQQHQWDNPATHAAKIKAIAGKL
jgi:hypothetical protein